MCLFEIFCPPCLFLFRRPCAYYSLIKEGRLYGSQQRWCPGQLKYCAKRALAAALAAAAAAARAAALAPSRQLRYISAALKPVRFNTPLNRESINA